MMYFLISLFFTIVFLFNTCIAIKDQYSSWNDGNMSKLLMYTGSVMISAFVTFILLCVTVYNLFENSGLIK